MDNPAAQILPVPSQPAVSRKFLWLAAGLTVLTLGITVGVFSAKFLNQSQKQLQQNQPISAPAPLPAEASAQESDLTADWKTYTNNIYGVSFKYPSDATFCQDVDGIRFAKFEDPKLTCKTDPISVQNLLRLSKKPIGQTYNLYQEWEKTNALKVFKKEKSILAGKEVMTFSGMYNGNAIRFKIIIIPIGKDDVILDFEGDGENDPRWDQILSTFKFLETTSTQPVITSPAANSKVTSPLTINGTVPAGWMFEGVFPIKLVDANKNLIVQGQGKEAIPGSWSSGKTVEFIATLTFTTASKSGFVVLEKDNPSGLPENNMLFEIPVDF